MNETHDPNTQDSIRALLQTLLDQKGDRRPFTDADCLITTGRLDSLNVIELITFLEDKFKIDFADEGFDQRELDSVDAILNRVGA